MLSIKYHSKVFGMMQPGIEARSPGPLANTLTVGKNKLTKLHKTLNRNVQDTQFPKK